MGDPLLDAAFRRKSSAVVQAARRVTRLEIRRAKLRRQLGELNDELRMSKTLLRDLVSDQLPGLEVEAPSEGEGL